MNWGRLLSWEIDLHCKQILLLFKHGRFLPGRSIQGISISLESICEQYQKTPLTGLRIALIEESAALGLELTCTNNQGQHITGPITVIFPLDFPTGWMDQLHIKQILIDWYADLPLYLFSEQQKWTMTSTPTGLNYEREHTLS